MQSRLDCAINLPKKRNTAAQRLLEILLSQAQQLHVCIIHARATAVTNVANIGCCSPARA